MKILNLHSGEINTERIPANISGTYFLMNMHNEVVYVGKATSVYSRLLQHKREKDFDRIIVIETNNSDEAKYLESVYLNINKPLLNTICPTYNDIPLWALRYQIVESEDNLKNYLCELIIDLKSDIRRDIEKSYKLRK